MLQRLMDDQLMDDHLMDDHLELPVSHSNAPPEQDLESVLKNQLFNVSKCCQI